MTFCKFIHRLATYYLCKWVGIWFLVWRVKTRFNFDSRLSLNLFPNITKTSFLEFLQWLNASISDTHKFLTCLTNNITSPGEHNLCHLFPHTQFFSSYFNFERFFASSFTFSLKKVNVYLKTVSNDDVFLVFLSWMELSKCGKYLIAMSRFWEKLNTH